MKLCDAYPVIGLGFFLTDATLDISTFDLDLEHEESDIQYSEVKELLLNTTAGEHEDSMLSISKLLWPQAHAPRLPNLKKFHLYDKGYVELRPGTEWMESYGLIFFFHFKTFLNHWTRTIQNWRSFHFPTHGISSTCHENTEQRYTQCLRFCT